MVLNNQSKHDIYMTFTTIMYGVKWTKRADNDVSAPRSEITCIGSALLHLCIWLNEQADEYKRNNRQGRHTDKNNLM